MKGEAIEVAGCVSYPLKNFFHRKVRKERQELQKSIEDDTRATNAGGGSGSG